MIKRGDGRIINISSCAGNQGELTDPEEIVELIEFLIQQPKKTLYKQLVFFPTVEWY